MRAASFDPTSLNAAIGAVVVFDNSSTVVHDVVFDAPLSPGVADIGQINAGATASRTFTTAGTWNFHCTIHGGMTGKVVVP
jgi:plastocyanin